MPGTKGTLDIDLDEGDQSEPRDEGGQGGHLLQLFGLLLHLPLSVVHASPPHLHRANEADQAQQKQPRTSKNRQASK